MPLKHLTQNEIEQIPPLILKKIEQEYSNLQNQLHSEKCMNIKHIQQINEMHEQINKNKQILQSINTQKYHLEIENEALKYRNDCLLRVVQLSYIKKTDDNNIEVQDSTIKKNITEEHHNNSISKEHHNTTEDHYNNSIFESEITNNMVSENSSNNIHQVVNKLLKKIKKKSASYKQASKMYLELKSKYNDLYNSYIKCVTEKDKICEEYTKRHISYEKYKEFEALKSNYKMEVNKNNELIRNYNILNHRYNELCLQYNYINQKYNEINSKYNRYILGNRNDILPLIGNEIDNLKKIVSEIHDKYEKINCKEVVSEYMAYICVLKEKIKKYKAEKEYCRLLLREIKKEDGLLARIEDILRNSVNLHYEINNKYREMINRYKKDISVKSEIINSVCMERNPSLGMKVDFNSLLLEIYNYKKEIEKLKKEREMIQGSKDIHSNGMNTESSHSVIDSQLVDHSIKDSQLVDIKSHNCALIEEMYKSQLQEANGKISSLEIKIEKLKGVLGKLKVIKDEYIKLKSQTSK